MISFSQFLQESRSAPLYHATRTYFLYDILKNGIDPVTVHPAQKLLKPLGGGNFAKPESRGSMPSNHYTGVSLTRNKKFAEAWSDGAIKVVLEVDQLAISQRYQILPIQFWNGRTRLQSPANEFEEFVLTNKPIPSKFIKVVWFAEDNINYYDSQILQALKAIENCKQSFPQFKFKEFKY